MSRENIKAFLFGASLVAALFLGAIFHPMTSPLKAQLAAPNTWIPASAIGGTANALTITMPNVSGLNDLIGVPLHFFPLSNNAAGATTINVNTTSNVAVKRATGTGLWPIAGGDFNSAVLAEVIYDGTQFNQTNPATGNAPVGSEVTLTNTTLPNGYLIENGTCVSQTTYSALFSYYGGDVWTPGSTGAACSGGNFHLPFANGRAAVAYDQQGAVTAGVLTSAGSGCSATTVAVPCGSQNRALSSTAQLPQFTPSGSVSSTMTSLSLAGLNLSTTAGATTVLVSNGGLGTVQFSSAISSAFTGSAIGSASPSPFTTVQPTYTVMKAVKY